MTECGSSSTSDAVARAEGTSTDGPRALESEHLLARLDQYDPDVSAGVAADAAALIRDLQAQLARVTAERDEAREQFDRHVIWAAEQAEAAEAALSKRQYPECGCPVQQIEQGAGESNLLRALKAEASLSAHREAPRELLEQSDDPNAKTGESDTAAGRAYRLLVRQSASK